MPVLLAGANITLPLTDYDSITVSSRVSVLVEAVSGLGIAAGKIAEVSGTRQFGPYSPGGSIKLTATGANVHYEVSDGVAPTSNVTTTAVRVPSGVQKNTPVSGSGAGSPASYVRTRNAIARVKAKTGNMRIGFIGDSTQTGAFSLGAGVGVIGNRAVSHVAFCAAALNSKETPAISSSFWGDQNITGATVPQYDPRITWGAGWGVATGRSIGGFMHYNATTTNALTFLPTNPVDTFEVYYAIAAGAAEFTISRTGDTTTSAIVTAGANGIGKYTFVGALSDTNPISIQRNGNGAGLFIIGINAYNSAESSIQCFNWGWSSGAVADWVVSTLPYNPLPAMVNAACDHYVITYGINEWASGVNLATSTANLATIVDTLLAVGDVSLCTGYPSQKASASLAVQKTYIDALYGIAAARNLVVNDVWHKVGSYEQGNAMGYYANNLHPLAKLYQLKAESDASMILSL